MTLVSIPLMDRTGRRTLQLYGLGGMFIFSIFITISFLIKASKQMSCANIRFKECLAHLQRRASIEIVKFLRNVHLPFVKSLCGLYSIYFLEKLNNNIYARLI